MLPYSRLVNILMYLMTDKEVTSPEKLSEVFMVSERTIRSDVKIINECLENYKAEVVHLRTQGYKLIINDEKLFQKFYEKHLQKLEKKIDLESPEKRINYLIERLLYENRYHTLDELADIVFVTPTTVSNYLKTMKLILSEFNLELKNKSNFGYKIVGNEDDKRNYIIDSLAYDLRLMPTEYSIEQRRIFEGIDLNQLENIIVKHTNIFDTRFSDFDLKNLVIHFALIISRINHGFTIDYQTDIKIDDDVIEMVEPLVVSIEKFYDISIPEQERTYLYSHFIRNLKPIVGNGGKYQIDVIIEDILSSIKKNYHFDLIDDQTLINDLNLHFRAILLSKQYSMNKKNPLYKTITTSYPFEFEMTLTAIRQISKKHNLNLNNDEIAYVALHIGASLERNFYLKKYKKNVVIVCGTGYPTLRMIEAIILNAFSDKVNVIDKCTYREYLERKYPDNIDFVISTVMIPSSKIPVIQIEFPIEQYCLDKIYAEINKSDVFDEVVTQYFEDDLFFIFDTIEKNELPYIMSDVLLKKGYVNDNYLGSVYEREKLASTLMNGLIAIPHPLEVFSNVTKIAVAIIDKPVKWTEEESAQIILLLSIAEEDRFELKQLFKLFVELMMNDDSQKKALKSKKLSQFLKILRDLNTNQEG